MSRAFIVCLIVSLVLHAILLTMSYVPKKNVPTEVVGLVIKFGNSHPQVGKKSRDDSQNSIVKASFQNPNLHISGKEQIEAQEIQLKRSKKQKSDQKQVRPIHKTPTLLTKNPITVLSSDIKPDTSFVTAGKNRKNQEPVAPQVQLEKQTYQPDIHHQALSQRLPLADNSNNPSSLAIRQEYENTSLGYELGDNVLIDSVKTLGYQRVVALYFEKFRSYPAEAKELGLEGEGEIFVKLNRQGQVLRWIIVKSTGHAILDEALVQMIHNANPVLPVPADYEPNLRSVCFKIKFIYDLIEWNRRNEPIKETSR